METIRTKLATALRERLAIIGDEESRRRPEQHIKRLETVSNRIEALVASLPRPIDPRLAHFLERRSYEKALEMLDSMGATSA